MKKGCVRLGLNFLLDINRVENCDTSAVLRNPDDARVFLTHVAHQQGQGDHRPDPVEQLQSIPIQPWGETKARFKLLVKLKRGKNVLTFEFFRIRRALTIAYNPPQNER